MRSILIIQTAFLGDVILSTALIEKLTTHDPNLSIDFLCKKGCEGILKNNPHLRNVFTFDKSHGKLRQLFFLCSKVRKNKYDTVINVHRYFTSGLITVWSGAKEKIGFAQNPLSFLYTKKVPHHIGKDPQGNWKHEVERNQSLIEHLTNNAHSLPKIYPSAVAVQRASGYMLPNKPYICISPSSVWFTKRWLPEKWIELTNQLSTYTIYLLGAKSDYELCEQIKSGCLHPHVVNLAGMDLESSAVLMQAARMNVVNDSAPLHLCTAMQAPVRAIFCSTTASFGFGTMGENALVIESKEDLPCKPCGFHGHQQCPKGHFQCAKSISINQVLETL